VPRVADADADADGCEPFVVGAAVERALGVDPPSATAQTATAGM
jgi:hypothetical protein